jgi:hypothetical protein
VLTVTGLLKLYKPLPVLPIIIFMLLKEVLVLDILPMSQAGIVAD